MVVSTSIAIAETDMILSSIKSQSFAARRISLISDTLNESNGSSKSVL